jgi:hypothetical protein
MLIMGIGEDRAIFQQIPETALTEAAGPARQQIGAQAVDRQLKHEAYIAAFSSGIRDRGQHKERQAQELRQRFCHPLNLVCRQRLA